MSDVQKYLRDVKYVNHFLIMEKKETTFFLMFYSLKKDTYEKKAKP